MSPLKLLLQTTTHGDVHSARGARASVCVHPCAQLWCMRRFVHHSAPCRMLRVARKKAPSNSLLDCFVLGDHVFFFFFLKNGLIVSKIYRGNKHPPSFGCCAAQQRNIDRPSHKLHNCTLYELSCTQFNKSNSEGTLMFPDDGQLLPKSVGTVYVK
jgi:hypothetical protein